MDRSPGKLLPLEQDPQLAYLVRDWDFSRGRRFEAEAFKKFSSSLHHPSSSPDGSFFLLAVFRRYLFRLTEDSVSMALHCCLGGTPAGFHVTYMQDRHFRFSVSCKQVGLLVRALHRITTEHFDVYFHMWRDGGDRWEKERDSWNREEDASWTTVSHRKNRNKNRNSPRKQVHFRGKLVQDSPANKSRPSELRNVIKIGNIFCPIPDHIQRSYGACNLQNIEAVDAGSHSKHQIVKRPQANPQEIQIPVNRVFQNLKRDLHFNVQDDHAGLEEHARQESNTSQHKIRYTISPLFCAKCLGSGHRARVCRSKFRCLYCYNYGHKAKWCYKRLAMAKVKWAQRPNTVGQPCVNSNSKGKGEELHGELIIESLGSAGSSPPTTETPLHSPPWTQLPGQEENPSSHNRNPFVGPNLPRQPDVANAADQFMVQHLEGNQMNIEQQQDQDQMSEASNNPPPSADAKWSFVRGLDEERQSQIATLTESVAVPNVLAAQSLNHANQGLMQLIAANLSNLVNNGLNLHGHSSISQNILMSFSVIRLNLNGSRTDSIQYIIDPSNLARSAVVETTHIQNLEGTDRNPRGCPVSDLCLEQPINPTHNDQMVLALPVAAPVHGSSNQLYIRTPIKHTYSRRPKECNNQPQRKAVFQHNTEVTMEIQRNSRKRPAPQEAIPTAQTQRRSSRLNKKSNGHKNRTLLDGESASPVSTNTRSAKRKRIASQAELSDKLLLPPTNVSIDFPGLEQLEKHDKYPEIPITQILDVATTRCGLSPSEINAELLLAKSEAEIDAALEARKKRSSTKTTLTVING